MRSKGLLLPELARAPSGFGGSDTFSQQPDTMIFSIRAAILAPALILALSSSAQRWEYNYQKGDFGESNYKFASAWKYDAMLTSAAYAEYSLSLSVGRADKDGARMYVSMGGDMLNSLAWTVDMVKFTFEVKGEYETVVATPASKSNFLTFSTADNRELIPLLESGSRVQVEALTSSGNLFKEVFSLSGSTAAIARVRQ